MYRKITVTGKKCTGTIRLSSFSAAIFWSFPTFFRNLTDRTAPDIRHSGNRFGRLCLNLKKTEITDEENPLMLAGRGDGADGRRAEQRMAGRRRECREPNADAWLLVRVRIAGSRTNGRQDPLSERFVTLNGNWKFNWVRDADQRPTDFFRVGYNDKGWNDMPVPGLWELNGYGDPVYLNVGYAWRGWFKNDPPTFPSSRTTWVPTAVRSTSPAAWAGRQIVAHFGSVTSNIYLWVNGRYVGYSEDSKLEAEFDLTPYVKPGRNLIAFQVFRWCDGTYLEDQDFFRLSGVGRDLPLRARQTAITDIRVDAAPSADYTAGTVAVKALFPRQARDSVELALTGRPRAQRRVAAAARHERRGALHARRRESRPVERRDARARTDGDAQRRRAK